MLSHLCVLFHLFNFVKQPHEDKFAFLFEEFKTLVNISWSGPVHQWWFESIGHVVVECLNALNITVLLLLVFELTYVLMLELFYLEDPVSSQATTSDTMS